MLSFAVLLNAVAYIQIILCLRNKIYVCMYGCILLMFPLMALAMFTYATNDLKLT